MGRIFIGYRSRPLLLTLTTILFLETELKEENHQQPTPHSKTPKLEPATLLKSDSDTVVTNQTIYFQDQLFFIVLLNKSSEKLEETPKKTFAVENFSI